MQQLSSETLFSECTFLDFDEISSPSQSCASVSPNPSPIHHLPKTYHLFFDVFVSSFISAFKSHIRQNHSKLENFIRYSLKTHPSFITLSNRLSKIYDQSLVIDKKVISLNIRHIFKSHVLEVFSSFITSELSNLMVILDSDTSEFHPLFIHFRELLLSELPLNKINSIFDLIQSKLGVPKNPWQIDNILILRRMDSLARLMALQRDLSVCSAVTVMNDTIYIAANNSGVCEEIIIHFLYERLRLIRIFIKNILNHFSFSDIYRPDSNQYQENYLLCLKDFFEKLVLNGGTSSFALNLYQAITKLVTCFYSGVKADNEIPEYFRNALLGDCNIVILTPAMHQRDNVHHIYLSHAFFTNTLLPLDTGSLTLSYFSLQSFHRYRVNQFHCEQLIYLYFILKQLPLSDYAPIFFGISKLCCQICFNVFSTQDKVIFRGSHHRQKSNVANVIENLADLAHSSFFTIDKEYSKEIECFSGHKRHFDVDEVLTDNHAPNSSEYICSTPTKKIPKTTAVESPFISPFSNKTSLAAIG